MSEEVWTIARILNSSSQFLEEKGVESPRRNAELLLGKILSMSRVDLYVHHDRPLAEAELSELRTLLRRRGHHEPLQYILGEVEFCGLTFEIIPGLLVPRPETEELVEICIQAFSRQEGEAVLRILDIGTGSGCVAVALAARIPHAMVDAVDVDYDACTCTAQNASRHGVDRRVRALVGDLFSSHAIGVMSPPYDVIVSNPPYVTQAEHVTLAPEIRQHESARALVGGHDGLSFYRKIAELLPTLLKPGGFLAVEVGKDQSEKVAEILTETLESYVIHADISGIPRVVTGVRKQNP